MKEVVSAKQQWDNDKNILSPLSSDSRQVVASNVAWFKLAEFVRRGEKERAFSLYRLLTHSLNDQAFLKKLEADIWQAFDEQEGYNHYKIAAHMYKQEGRHYEALMIFEILATRSVDAIEYIQKVIELCEQLNLVKKRLQFQKLLCHAFIARGHLEKAHNSFSIVEDHLKDADKLTFSMAFVSAALVHHYQEQLIIQQHLHKTLNALIRTASQQKIQKFLATVEGLNAVWHKDAVEYLKQQ